MANVFLDVMKKEMLVGVEVSTLAANLCFSRVHTSLTLRDTSLDCMVLALTSFFMNTLHAFKVLARLAHSTAMEITHVM